MTIQFDVAKRLALAGIENYITGKPGEGGERYGFYHGDTGKSRASRLQAYLSNDSRSEEDILVALLAVFTVEPEPSCFFKNPFRNIGRSSKLASLIADEFLKGRIVHSGILNSGGNYKKITSDVFKPDDCKAAGNDTANFRGTSTSPTGSYQYFDKTKAVRQLLNQALNTQYLNTKNEIIKKVTAFRAELEQPAECESKPVHKSFNLMHHFR